jgi:hypothetical protein
MLLAALILALASPAAHAVAPGDPGVPADQALEAAAGRGLIKAYLDDRRISVNEIPEYYCHDFDYPEIRCFTTGEELDAASAPEAQLLAFMGGTYVTVYEHSTFNGAYMHISQDYDLLFLVNWNDRISSFRSRNCGSGYFWTDWFGGGNWYRFGCNQSVSILYGWNDTFSSVYRA